MNIYSRLNEQYKIAPVARRYMLADLLSESYRCLYNESSGTNLYKLYENFIAEVKSSANPNTSLLSSKLSTLKQVKSLIESNSILDKDLDKYLTEEEDLGYNPTGTKLHFKHTNRAAESPDTSGSIKLDESTYEDYEWEPEWHKEYMVPTRLKYYTNKLGDEYSGVFGTIYEPYGKEFTSYGADIYDNEKADVVANMNGFSTEDEAKKWVENWFKEHPQNNEISTNENKAPRRKRSVLESSDDTNKLVYVNVAQASKLYGLDIDHGTLVYEYPDDSGIILLSESPSKPDMYYIYAVPSADESQAEYTSGKCYSWKEASRILATIADSTNTFDNAISNNAYGFFNIFENVNVYDTNTNESTQLDEAADQESFQNAGFDWDILDTKGDYTLVHAAEKQLTPYVVAYKLDAKDPSNNKRSWGQGHYFDTEKAARKYLEKLSTKESRNISIRKKLKIVNEATTTRVNINSNPILQSIKSICDKYKFKFYLTKSVDKDTNNKPSYNILIVSSMTYGPSLYSSSLISNPTMNDLRIRVSNIEEVEESDYENYANALLDATKLKSELASIDITKVYESKKIYKYKKLRESLDNFRAMSKDKSFYKTLRTLIESLDKLDESKCIKLHKALTSALTHLTVELEHNPEFKTTFSECSTIISNINKAITKKITESVEISDEVLDGLKRFVDVIMNASAEAAYPDDEVVAENPPAEDETTESEEAEDDLDDSEDTEDDNLSLGDDEESDEDPDEVTDEEVEEIKKQLEECDKPTRKLKFKKSK